MRLIASILLLLVSAVWIPSAQAQEKPAELKELMGPNFETMSDMLSHILIDEDYRAVLEDARRIRRHAQLIQGFNGSKEMPAGSYFQNYASFLEAHATGLSLVAETIERERLQAKRSEHLRPQAAMHFGQMITMCVSCHNRFRPRSPAIK